MRSETILFNVRDLYRPSLYLAADEYCLRHGLPKPEWEIRVPPDMTGIYIEVKRPNDGVTQTAFVTAQDIDDAIEAGLSWSYRLVGGPPGMAGLSALAPSRPIRPHAIDAKAHGDRIHMTDPEKLARIGEAAAHAFNTTYADIIAGSKHMEPMQARIAAMWVASRLMPAYPRKKIAQAFGRAQGDAVGDAVRRVVDLRTRHGKFQGEVDELYRVLQAELGISPHQPKTPQKAANRIVVLT